MHNPERSRNQRSGCCDRENGAAVLSCEGKIRGQKTGRRRRMESVCERKGDGRRKDRDNRCTRRYQREDHGRRYVGDPQRDRVGEVFSMDNRDAKIGERKSFL